MSYVIRGNSGRAVRPPGGGFCVAHQGITQIVGHDMNTNKEAPKKELTKGEGITAIVVVVIFCLVAWQAITSTSKSDGTSAPAPVAVQPEQHSDVDAYIDAQAIVEKTLKSPSTAKFPSSSHATITRAGENIFKVDSYVDSQNGFGAMIRSEWSVMFEYVGDKLDTYAISIDGETVYKKAGL